MYIVGPLEVFVNHLKEIGLLKNRKHFRTKELGLMVSNQSFPFIFPNAVGWGWGIKVTG